MPGPAVQEGVVAVERTLAMVKPDGVKRNCVGSALAAAEAAGLRIVALKKMQMTRRQAEGFYAVHKERSFFGELTEFMSEGPVVMIVFEGDNAIATWRNLLGATNPAQAADGTLRKRFGTDIQRNGFHGSDAPETASFESGYLFSGLELAG